MFLATSRSTALETIDLRTKTKNQNITKSGPKDADIWVMLHGKISNNLISVTQVLFRL